VGRQDFDRAFVLTGHEGAGWSTSMSTEIDAALRFIGVESTLLYPENGAAAFAKASHRPFYCVDINNFFATPILEPKFSLMVDHPCSCVARATAVAATNIAGWVDATHVAAAAAIGLPFRSIFLPHAGPDPVAKPLPIRDRDIDVFFAGTLAEPIDRSSFATENPTMPALVIEIIFAAVEAMQRSLEPIIPIVLESCAQHGIDTKSLTRNEFCRLVYTVHGIAEINGRNAIIEALPDCRITVASHCLPKKLQDRPNLTYRGFVGDFDEIRQLMARSKIVLNATSKFPQGAHERIWYGMAEGAAILTDRSTYMETDFTHDTDILYLPLGAVSPRELADVSRLLDDTAALQRTVDAASVIYRQKHTWKQRIWTIHNAVRAG
jgi:hypothetical protein